MRTHEMVEVNGDAIREALEKRGISNTEAGKMLYKTNSYFYAVTKRGAMDKGDYMLMKFLFEQNGYPLTEEEISDIEMKPQVQHYFYLGTVVSPTEYGQTRLVCTLYEDDTEVASGFSNLRSNTRLEYASALAWATRCLWKKVEEECNAKGVS